MNLISGSYEDKPLRISAAYALEFLQFAMAEGMVTDLEGEKGVSEQPVRITYKFVRMASVR